MSENKKNKTQQQQDQNKDNAQDLNNIARKEAEHDLKEDPDSIHHPNDDLDEGETARLGEDKTGLV